MGAALRPFDPETSLLLAVESATSSLSVALQRGRRVLAECALSGTRQHAQTLLPLIDETLAKAQLELSEVDAFAVSIGPGTFTSLRIALSTIKGLAFGTDRPVAAVSTLAVVAHTAGADEEDTPRIALLDARRGEFYAGAFAGRSPFRSRDELLPESLYTLWQLVAELPERFQLVGEGALRLGEALRSGGRKLPSACRELAPQARSVAALGASVLARGEGTKAAVLVPRYLRKAQAEEDRVRRIGA